MQGEVRSSQSFGLWDILTRRTEPDLIRTRGCLRPPPPASDLPALLVPGGLHERPTHARELRLEEPLDERPERLGVLLPRTVGEMRRRAHHDRRAVASPRARPRRVLDLQPRLVAEQNVMPERDERLAHLLDSNITRIGGLSGSAGGEHAEEELGKKVRPFSPRTNEGLASRGTPPGPRGCRGCPAAGRRAPARARGPRRGTG
jgi:hypothetical protein